MNTFGGLVLVTVVILCIIFGPFLLLWSLNTLFGFTIAYTFKTWLASLILGSVVSGAKYTASSK